MNVSIQGLLYNLHRGIIEPEAGGSGLDSESIHSGKVLVQVNLPQPHNPIRQDSKEGSVSDWEKDSWGL